MDKGISIQNPYASVTIPRAQLKSSFIRNTLGEDLDGVVVANPAVVPSYPTYTAQVQDPNTSASPNASSWEGNKVNTRESWRKPYNPYASEKAQNGGHPETMYSIDLDKRYKEVEEKPCCCYPCCKCCPCCRKSCCVIS
ncbi:cysteine-rich tail protein 1 [Spea bombifrons]|uniref:cysteine-rich tail protein 1 n=1 Tax=Spea bombifrons TaxID=233779 RepID=UPI00234A0C0C|nr:cysteine-rich tail protein 1 [Spea bombifrons]